MCAYTNLKYGLLFIYTATVFVRDHSDSKVHVSMPVMEKDTDTSVRRAFLYFGHGFDKETYVKVGVLLAH